MLWLAAETSADSALSDIIKFVYTQPDSGGIGHIEQHKTLVDPLLFKLFKDGV